MSESTASPSASQTDRPGGELPDAEARPADDLFRSEADVQPSPHESLPMDDVEAESADTAPAEPADTAPAPDPEQAGADGVDAAPSVESEPDDLSRLENEGDIAADYLEELLDIADLDGDLDMDVEGDRASVSIVGGDVRLLVGREGEVLEALQELTRLAVYRETGERSRLMLDVGGFRADKRSRLEKIAAEAIAEVQESGDRKALAPMSPFERKVVHDVVAAAGLASASEGQEPRRYVVVLPR